LQLAECHNHRQTCAKAADSNSESSTTILDRLDRRLKVIVNDDDTWLRGEFISELYTGQTRCKVKGGL